MASEPPSSPCPDEESVEGFLEGRLGRDDRLAIERHIDGCPSCARLIAGLLTRWSARTGGSMLPTHDAAGRTADGRFHLDAGQKVGRFMILGSIGSGGMGAVYAAYDTTLDRKIALKFPSRAGATEVAKARLVAEAGAMAKLSHPNVVTVHDVGMFEGEPYLAMELVEGGATLATWNADRARSARDIATVMAAAARGLAAAHAAGIIHRDVKPHNVLIAGHRVLVTDFGLSVAADSGGGRGTAAGTPGYMAPEQFDGRALDARSDVFGLCATLYHVLHGIAPFAGATVAEVRERVRAGQITAPPAGSRAPPRLHRLALRGLSVNPDDRPPDATAVERALLADPALRRRRFAAAAVGVGVLAATFWGGGFLRGNPERRCRASAAVLDGAWNDGRRAQLRAHYAAAGKSEAWPVLERRLDQHAQAWRAMHAATCAATYGQRRQSEQVLDLRMSCLDGRRAALDAFVTAVAATPPAGLVRAAGAQLPPPDECDLTARSLTRPLPADAGQRARIAGVEAALGKVNADLVLGNYPRAAAAVTGAVKSAQEIGYEPLLGRALLQAGRVEARRSGLADSGPGGQQVARGKAMSLLEQALAAAERGGDDGTRAVAARELVLVHHDADRLREAQMWADLTAALLARLGNPALERASLEMNIGWLKLKSDKRQESAAAFARALELRQRALGPRHADTALSLLATCEAHRFPGDMLSCQKKAVGILEAAVGTQHPQVAHIYGNMWTPAVVDDPRNTAEGCAALEKAARILEANVERTDPNLLINLTNLGYCLSRLGKPAEARARFQDGLARAAGALTQSRARLHRYYGGFLLENGDFEEAARHQRLAIADWQKLFGDVHDSTLTGWINLVQTHRVAKRPERALAALEEIIPRCEAAPQPPWKLPDLYLEKGETLRALARDREGIAAHTRGLELYKRLGYPPEELQYSYHGLGECHSALGQVDEAIENLERSLSLIKRGEVRPMRWAEAALALGTTLGRRRADRKRACEVLAEAAAEFGRDGADMSERIAVVRKERARLGCPAPPAGAEPAKNTRAAE